MSALRRLPGGLAGRLFLAQLLVILAGAGTLLVVALAIGPGIFHRHVQEALGLVPPDVSRHLDHAFDQATLVALGVAVAAALATALVVGLLVTRRVVRPVRDLADAADTLAAGNTSARVDESGVDELAGVARAFNAMAAELEATEGRRRSLLADIAHELRTPLATVDGYLEGLVDGVVVPDAETWQALRTETGRLNRLVDDLRRVSLAEERQLDLRLEATAPTKLVGAAAAASRIACDTKGIALRTEIAAGLPPVQVDPDRIAEVFSILLENAVRHTPAGGTIAIAAQHAPGGSGVEISVADTGTGIALEHLPRIFERFYRADPARARASGGSGIGLAIAKALVEAHGGTIHAESDGHGCGTRIVLRLR